MLTDFNLGWIADDHTPMTFLGRLCDARTGAYETTARDGCKVVVVGKTARNVVARMEPDGSVTVSDCGWRTTSTSKAINIALQRWKVPGWCGFEKHRLSCFGFKGEARADFTSLNHPQTINNVKGVL